MTANRANIIERIEALFLALTPWAEDGCNFSIWRVEKMPDGVRLDATPDKPGSCWRVEIKANGTDGVQEFGEGGSTDAALADLISKLKSTAEKRIGAIQEAARL